MLERSPDFAERGTAAGDPLAPYDQGFENGYSTGFEDGQAKAIAGNTACMAMPRIGVDW